MILIIASDESSYKKLSEFFAEKKIPTIFANSYINAIELTKTTTLTAIISEFQLDEHTGIQVLGRLRSYGIRAPFFLITNHVSEISLKEAFKQGVEAVFKKPLSVELLGQNVFESITHKNEWSLRRKKPRVSTSVQIEFEASQLQGKYTCTATSIGLGGMFLCSGNILPNVGDFVAFSIKASPHNRFPVEGEGVVRWVRLNSSNEEPIGFGIEFYCLTDEGYQQISELYNSLRTVKPASVLLEHQV
ncbi:MAG: response regulator [Pseudomonadota bacterium]|nr:response regulator [Pseudomonadota bacterium]